MTHTTTSSQCRRYERAEYRIPLQIVTPDGEIPCTTSDLSYSGIFIETDHLLTPRKLIKLRIGLEGDDPLEVLAMVARVIDTPERRGMGCSFYGNSRAEMRRWETFVQSVLDAGIDEAMTTRARHLMTEVPVEFESVEGLASLFRDSLASGRIVVNLGRDLPAGAPVRLVFEMPEQDQRFTLVARVLGPRSRRADDDAGDTKGVVLELLEDSRDTQDRVIAFLRQLKRLTPPPAPAHPAPAAPTPTAVAGDDSLVVPGDRGVAINAGVPVLGDTEGLMFTGLVTEEIVLIDDFMDDLFDEFT